MTAWLLTLQTICLDGIGPIYKVIFQFYLQRDGCSAQHFSAICTLVRSLSEQLIVLLHCIKSVVIWPSPPEQQTKGKLGFSGFQAAQYTCCCWTQEKFTKNTGTGHKNNGCRDSTRTSLWLMIKRLRVIKPTQVVCLHWEQGKGM